VKLRTFSIGYVQAEFVQEKLRPLLFSNFNRSRCEIKGKRMPNLNYEHNKSELKPAVLRESNFLMYPKKGEK